ncbi:hypothetical protein AC482_03540 [miscellaneous Crenarchaeota group-15 archaeon DG-45]|uniref:Mechanosensitive ion channel protein MscS n=1 Tax=miscellaneous Crenarchaeota group-15 archaeon DG-45 TaxID=1685127 RepID=A0A0M0BQ29_9ARCH|nr:MAG: hypothetical protein AC482_03540 [miscellaneous Crenarchaeota group-15 archaeon DG-45]
MGDWMISHFNQIFYSIVTLVLIYVVFKVSTREIGRLREQQRLEEHLAYTLTRIGRWSAFLVALTAVLAQFGVTLSLISGLLTILGGTIVGFAAINTIGNAIAGLIVMTSRPFKVGDRIYFKGQFADVTAVELIYTKMVTLDNILVSVPNQELLKEEIADYGRDRVVRRHVTITPGYKYDIQYVERALLEAAGLVPEVLREPEPYVRITNFKDYAVEYKLYAFISEVKSLLRIEADLHRSVLETCRKYEIDISTPMLIQQIQD